MNTDKPLFLILKSEWYWKIFRKEKSIEYRIKSKRNISLIKNQKFVVFQLGYNSANKMKIPILKIEQTENQFNIHLDIENILIVSLKLKNTYQTVLF